MLRLALAALAGLVLGVALVLLAGQRTTEAPANVTRDLVVPAAMSDSEARAHREERYARLDSIEQVLALPGDFARAEALYAIAGRADSAAVQGLLFEANRVADRDIRRNLQAILVECLTELDPASALALTRSGHLSVDHALERIVWTSWARRDLDAALAAAHSLPARRDRDRAAQAMFAARGYHGTEAVLRIERETGIRPSVQTLSAYLYELADRSMVDAVNFIDGETSADRRIQLAHRLAAYLVAADPARATGLASLFRDPALQRQFAEAVTREHAALDPDAFLPLLLPGGRRPDNRTAQTVLQALVERDLAAAMGLVDRLASQQDRNILGGLVARRLAETDPLRAFEWARSRPGGGSEIVGSVLGFVATQDTELAIELAGQLSNRMDRSEAMMYVVSRLAFQDPGRAAELSLAAQEDGRVGSMLPSTVARWLEQDRDAALAWIAGLEPRQRREILTRGGAQLVHRDPELAISLLPSLDGEAAAQLRRNIVSQLAATGSVARAQELIARVPAGENVDALRSALASGVAEHDAQQARQLVEQIVDPRTRDSAYSQLVQLHAMSDPVEALGWLSAIANDELRASSAGGPVGEWYRREPDAALRWVVAQPRGAMRDAAIAALSGYWPEPTADQQRLIASIDDDETRYQAQVRQLYLLGESDPQRARTLLAALDLPQDHRRRVERYLDSQLTGHWPVR